MYLYISWFKSLNINPKKLYLRQQIYIKRNCTSVADVGCRVIVKPLSKKWKTALNRLWFGLLFNQTLPVSLRSESILDIRQASEQLVIQSQLFLYSSYPRRYNHGQTILFIEEAYCIGAVKEFWKRGSRLCFLNLNLQISKGATFFRLHYYLGFQKIFNSNSN